MSYTQAQQEAWSVALNDGNLKKEALSLDIVLSTIVVFVMAAAVSALILAFFGSGSDYMAGAALSIPVICAMHLYLMDRQASAAVKASPDTAPIMNSRVKIGACLVVVSALIGHFTGFALAPFLISML